MKPEDLMALLFHDREFSALPPPDQEELRNHMPRFSFLDPEEHREQLMGSRAWENPMPHKPRITGR